MARNESGTEEHKVNQDSPARDATSAPGNTEATATQGGATGDITSPPESTGNTVSQGENSGTINGTPEVEKKETKPPETFKDVIDELGKLLDTLATSRGDFVTYLLEAIGKPLKNPSSNVEPGEDAVKQELSLLLDQLTATGTEVSDAWAELERANEKDKTKGLAGAVKSLAGRMDELKSEIDGAHKELTAAGETNTTDDVHVPDRIKSFAKQLESSRAEVSGALKSIQAAEGNTREMTLAQAVNYLIEALAKALARPEPKPNPKPAPEPWKSIVWANETPKSAASRFGFDADEVRKLNFRITDQAWAKPRGQHDDEVIFFLPDKSTGERPSRSFNPATAGDRTLGDIALLFHVEPSDIRLARGGTIALNASLTNRGDLRIPAYR